MKKLFLLGIFLSTALCSFGQGKAMSAAEVEAQQVEHDSAMNLSKRLVYLRCRYSTSLARPANDYLINALVATPCGGEIKIGVEYFYVYRNPNFQRRYLLVGQDNWNILKNHEIGVPTYTFALFYDENEIWITSMRCSQ